MGENTDGTLARRAAAGDRDTFAALLERHYDRVYRVGARGIGCGARADAYATASAVPKMRVNGRGEDVIFFDGVFFKPSLKSIFFVS